MGGTEAKHWNRLGTHLMGTFALLVALVVLVVAFSAWNRSRLVLEDSLRTHARTLLTSLEADAGSRIANRDVEFFNSYLEDLAWKDPTVVYAVVVGSDNVVMAHSEPSFVGKRWEEPPGPAWGAMKIKERTTLFGPKQKEVFELTIPVEREGKRIGSLQLGLQYDSVRAGLRSITRNIVIAGVVTLVLSMLAAHLLSRRITNGLSTLVDGASMIASGDIRGEVPETGYEEWKMLASAFNSMRVGLRPLLLRIQQMGGSIGGFTDRISGIVAAEAAASSQEAASIAEITATMEELTRTSHQIASIAGGVRDSATRSVDMAKEGSVLIDDAVRSMDRIGERVEEIERKIHFLAEKSAEIGTVMKLIKEIAGEIHLLALNAAIESAAAGEHGRRFSVVASEVRRLAEKTRESTETIRAVVTEIQTATAESAKATEEGFREVGAGRDQMRRSAASFEKIIEVVELTSESSSQISMATSQQTHANEQVVTVMRQVEETIRETATRIRGIHDETARLKGMAEELREGASVFRV